MKNHKREINLVLLFICLLFGIVFSMQIKSVMIENELKKSRTKIEEFKDKYNSIISQNNLMQNEIDNIEKKIKENQNNEIRKQSEKNVNLPLDDFNSKIKKYQFIAGLTDVKGEGIIIKINDADINDLKALSINIDNIEELSQYTIHDSDIKRILYELKDAGAQAISINEERIIIPSRILCSGPTILINTHLYAAPYVIKIIGDKNDLYEKLSKNPYIQLLLQNKLRVEIISEDEIYIKKYNLINLENYISHLKEDKPE